MKKQLVAITSVILVSLGATMTIVSQSHNQPTIEVNQSQGLSELSIIDAKEMINANTVLVEDIEAIEETQVTQEQVENQINQHELSGNESSNQLVEAPSTPVQNTSEQSKKPSTPELRPSVTPEDEGAYLSAVEQLIFEKVNVERQKAGLSMLSYDQTMQKYARSKSADMGNRSYFSHENPEGQLITASMQQDGVSYSAWGENIAYIGGISDPQALADQFMTNWMNSEGHRANILSSNFNSMGIGVYEANGKVYATQEFYR